MTASSSSREPARNRVTVALAIVWLIGFAYVFFQLELPNAPAQPDGTRLYRADVWSLLPDLLLYSVFEHPELANDPLSLPSGWKYFPQRLPFIAVAGVILFAAWGLGSLLLRALRPPWSLCPGERMVFAFALGLSALSLLTLGLGLLAQVVPGAMSRGVLGSLTVLAGIGGLIVELRARACSQHSATASNGEPRKPNRDAKATPTLIATLVRGQIPYATLVRTGMVLAMMLFVLAMALGAMLPSIDFDVKEYHLQGPKEHFQAGHIAMLPHNVYTSFPFLTEMLSLLAMVLSGDWFAGALAGKLVLMSFAPLTAAGVFVATKRWFSEEAAWAATLIHLTTPWTYRISIIAYAEGGLTFFLFATLLAVLMTVTGGGTDNETAGDGDDGSQSHRWRAWLLCGLLGGSAMACKYPGVVSVVIPLGVVLLVHAWKIGAERRGAAVIRTGLVYSCGVLIAIGPWLVKNLLETGNPVYPLLNSVFHGADWTPTLEANWKAAHSPDHHDPRDLLVKLFDVTMKSDWLSPLLFGLAPLAFLVLRQRRLVHGLSVYVGFLFLSWWVLTHRIDRFWVPLIPVVSVLAGVGLCWSSERTWRYSAAAVVGLCVLFNLGFITTGNCGFNQWLGEMDSVTRQAEAATAPGIAAINQKENRDSLKVLCVGEAQVFDARFPLVYNTVFDVSIFETWCSADVPDQNSADQPLQPVDEIRRRFADEGITHVLVNWQEVLRYRMTYGYTEFVAPHRFVALQEAGLLVPDPEFRSFVREFSDLSASEQADVREWAPELIDESTGTAYFITTQLFVVQR